MASRGNDTTSGYKSIVLPRFILIPIGYNFLLTFEA